MITSGDRQVEEVTEDDFDSLVLENDRLTIVDFFATWCGPCKMLSPIIDEVAQIYKDVSFYKVNIDNNMNLTEKYEVEAVPTVLFFKEGKLLKTKVGYMEMSEIEETINELL